MALRLYWRKEVRVELSRCGIPHRQVSSGKTGSVRLPAVDRMPYSHASGMLKSEALHSGLASESISTTCIKQEFAEFDVEPGASTAQEPRHLIFLRKAKSSLRGLPAPDDPWYWPGGPSRDSFLFELQAEQLCILRLGWSGARSVSGPARPLSDTCLFIHREECNGLGLKSQDPGSRFCRCRWRCRGPREVHDRPLREPGNRPDALFHPS